MQRADNLFNLFRFVAFVTFKLWKAYFWIISALEASKWSQITFCRLTNILNSISERFGAILIVLVEFLLKFNSNNGFQLFLDILWNFWTLKRSPGLSWQLKLKSCTRAHHFFNNFNFFKLKFSSKTLAKRKKRRHFVDEFQPLHPNGWISDYDINPDIPKFGTVFTQTGVTYGENP